VPTRADIQTRRLGDALEVSAVGLGCNQLGRTVDEAGTRALVDAALESGVTLFDTADVYGGGGESERLLGLALRGRRERAVIATKFGMDMRSAGGLPDVPRGSARYVRAACEGSLRRLGSDWIDLYQYHEPDGVTPVAETLGALDELVRAGKVRAVGCSNFTAEGLRDGEAESQARATARFVSLQNRYSLLERGLEADVGPVCQELGVGILPYFPLARGLLTGKYRRGHPPPEGSRLAGQATVAEDEVFDRLDALERYAAERGVDMLTVAIGGLAAQPAVASVIAGARLPGQVAANAPPGPGPRPWTISPPWTPSCRRRSSRRHLSRLSQRVPLVGDDAAAAVERLQVQRVSVGR
jgi:aryl-alcohol dehydrogenase-like predicted oxidoreductase